MIIAPCKADTKEDINPFVPNAPFLYALKTSENRKIFWCFQEVEKSALGTNGLKYEYRLDSYNSPYLEYQVGYWCNETIMKKNYVQSQKQIHSNNVTRKTLQTLIKTPKITIPCVEYCAESVQS